MDRAEALTRGQAHLTSRLEGGVAMTVEVLAAARLLYVLARVRLSEQLDYDKEPDAPAAADIAVRMASEQVRHVASSLTQGGQYVEMAGLIKNVIMPWMLDAAEALGNPEAEKGPDAQKEIDLGLAVVPLGGSVVFAGPADAVVAARAAVVMSIDGLGWRYARLKLDGLTSFGACACEVAERDWQGRANSRTRLRELLAQLVDMCGPDPLDVLVCDDLAQARTADYQGRTVGATCGDARKLFGDWCRDQSVLFVTFLATDDDLTSLQFEEIRTNARLFRVVIAEGGLEAKEV